MPLVKPTLGQLEWGDEVNAALDYLDAQGVAAQDTADEALAAAEDAAGALIPAGERLVIYYGIPANVQLYFDPEKAAQVFSRWDLIVFGEGLQEPSHPDHASTITVVNRIKALNPKAKIFGYVSLGITTANLTEAQMKDRVDKWKANLGADGMLLDEVGYEYQVPRARQNTMIDYVHGKSMTALINVWEMDDAFASTVNATYNPAGTPTTADSRDYCLLESWIYNTSSQPGPQYNADIFNIRARGDKARTYRASKGVKMLGASVVDYSTTTDTQQQNFFRITEDFARMFGLDGWAVDALNYSASGGAGNLATVKLWNYDRTPLPRLSQYSVSLDSLTLTRYDLPLTITGTTTAAGTSVFTSSEDTVAAPAVEDAGKSVVTRTVAGPTIQRVNNNFNPAISDPNVYEVAHNGTLVAWQNENGHFRARVASHNKSDSTFRAIQVAAQTGHPFEYENEARTTQLWAIDPTDGATKRSGVKMNDVLVLGAADPIPAGTPAGTVILRTG